MDQGSVAYLKASVALPKGTEVEILEVKSNGEYVVIIKQVELVLRKAQLTEVDLI
jgi:hypothetical protein